METTLTTISSTNNTLHITLLSTLLLLILITSTTPTQSATTDNDPCNPTSCDPHREPMIRFPFRLRERQPVGCGFAGVFDLSCDPSTNLTLLTLPRSGEFVVDYIDYRAQAVFVSDPGSCLPNRSFNFSLADSPFEDSTFMNDYVLMNCSSADYGSDNNGRGGANALPCLSGGNYSVVAVRRGGALGAGSGGCRWVRNVSVPLVWMFDSEFGPVKDDFELVWSEPDCKKCETEGGICGFKADGGGSSSVGCKRSGKGLPKSAKYAIIIVVGVPGLLCMIGLACYAFGVIRFTNLHRRLNFDLHTTTTTSTATATLSRTNVTGLDLPTISSYPKTVLGQSKRLPNPNDNACAICLSEYEPKETVKTIPECNHFFHEDCIDEWLKLNGTCPLCRSSLESSSRGTHCDNSPSSMSPNFSSPTASEHH